MSTPRCCLTTPDPGAWTAGKDDSADGVMINRMHAIRERMNYHMSTDDLLYCLKASVNIDSRTKLGGDLQRCLLSVAAHRLELLAKHIDPSPWLTMGWRYRLERAWDVFRGRALAVWVKTK